MGYESYDEITVSRQVVIGGRNKYLINGNNATPSRVQDLFRSVSLNINNPHFLIMQVKAISIQMSISINYFNFQGRITKVLNMKPPEVYNAYTCTMLMYVCIQKTYLWTLFTAYAIGVAIFCL